MTTPRVRLGAYGDGHYGLKIALPGYDVTTTVDDNDSNKRSFNSQWSVLTKVSQIGIASANFGTTVPISPSLGYTPFVEGRISDSGGTVFYDDYCNGSLNLPIFDVSSSNITVITGLSGGYFFYLVFQKQMV
jgi:hypothetical protein